MTRVGWVRVELGPEGPVCSVVGTGRRHLVERRVPLPVATRLIAQGVPSVVRHPSMHRPVPVGT